LQQTKQNRGQKQSKVSPAQTKLSGTLQKMPKVQELIKNNSIEPSEPQEAQKQSRLNLISKSEKPEKKCAQLSRNPEQSTRPNLSSNFV